MSAPANFSRPLKVAILSDVSVGYGTPQILHMAESFAHVYQAEVQIYEPDEPDRMPVDIKKHLKNGRISLTRLYTAAHPYWLQGRIEYCRRAAEYIKSFDPDILLFSTMYGIEVLDQVSIDKRLTIFYGLEDIDTYYSYLFPLVRKCNIRVFPEENRRRIYSERLGLQGDENPNLIIYNANNNKFWTPPEERGARIFYGGSFDRRKNFAEYYLDSTVQRIPIDIFGLIRGFDDNEAIANLLNGAQGGVTYRGYRQSDNSFFKLLSNYLYSIVIWNPDREDHFYACPNKLFDAISCGVPPICAPHPQCIEIIRKWKCGILLDDWSFESFKAALMRAVAAAGSDYYCELAHNCRLAMEIELSWDHQFEKLTPYINRNLKRFGIANDS